MYEELGNLAPYAELNDKKDEFVKVSMEMVDIKKQIRNLQSELKVKEEYANVLMNRMMDICGSTGLTIYCDGSEKNAKV